MKTKDWKPSKPALALVIGHDPGLQKSETQASYALFADYYFKPLPSIPSEKSKYGLTKSTFDQIAYLSNNQIDPKSIYITNLCNDSLTYAPTGKTVLIPESKAKQGISKILQIINDNPSIEYIFPMSLQVNYWLQKLGFYESNTDFVTLTEPKEKGIKNVKPYFSPRKPKTFQLICGNMYNTSVNEKVRVIPILHAKNYPLNGRFIEAYSEPYERIKKNFI